MTSDKTKSSKYEDLLSEVAIDWKPETLRLSAWLAHVPFAFWVISAVRPNCVVELGTHSGVSYFAFCQAVERLGMNARCFAVDTWHSDARAGLYGDEIFADVLRVNESRYRSFSTLLRTTFDDASPYFSDGEVDLLHIDGSRTYVDITRDFNIWRKKLSPRGVLLFHDINTRKPELGAWKLWRELTDEYPHFAFEHGHGLGVLGVGHTHPPPIEALFRASGDNTERHRIQSRFVARGRSVELAYQLTAAQTPPTQTTPDPGAEQRALRDELRSLREAFQKLAAESNRLADERVSELAQLRNEHIADKLLAGEETANALRRAHDRYRNELSILRRRYWLIRKPSARKLTHLLGLIGGESGSSEIRQVRTPFSEVHRTPFAQTNNKRASLLCSSTKGRKVTWVGGEPETPGYRYRVIHPVEAADAAGFSATHMPADQIGTRWQDLSNADVIVLWRTPWDKTIEKLITTVRQRGGNIVFDVDDLIFEPALATAEMIDGIRSQELSESGTAAMFERFRTTLLAVDMCTAPTAELVTCMRGLGRPAFELCNGYDALTLETSQHALRQRQSKPQDNFVRIGYAAGTNTHQRDFAVCAGALAKVLRNHPSARLVLFCDKTDRPYLNPLEFPELLAVAERIEWRKRVPLSELPSELARFDVNIAPLQVGNPFCEAKSELKYFEAALVDVCTIASPTGPYRRAINHGLDGLLASDENGWHESLSRLIESPEERARLIANARHKILERYGPKQRIASVTSILGKCSRNSQLGS